MPVSNLCCFFGSQITNGIRNILKIAPDIGHLPIVAFLLFTVVSKSYAGRFFGTWHCLLFKLPSSRHTPIEVTPVCVHVVCACSSLSGHSAWQAALHVSHSQHKRLPCTHWCPNTCQTQQHSGAKTTLTPTHKFHALHDPLSGILSTEILRHQEMQ